MMNVKVESKNHSLSCIPGNGRKYSTWEKLKMLMEDLYTGLRCFFISKLAKKKDWLSEEQVRNEYYNGSHKK